MIGTHRISTPASEPTDTAGRKPNVSDIPRNPWYVKNAALPTSTPAALNAIRRAGLAAS